MPYLSRFDSTEFRLGKLYKEGCDRVLRKHLVTLQSIYKRASSFDIVPGEDTIMNINEFLDLILFSGVTEEKFASRDIGTLFNLSIMT